MNSRRNFLKGIGAVGVATAGVAVSSGALAGVSSKAFAADLTAKVKLDERGFIYFGEEQNVQEDYMKSMTMRAKPFDFGLSAEQEAKASAITSRTMVFDGEFEVDYYKSLFPNMLSNKAKAVGGSMTLGVMGLDLINGRSGNEMEVIPTDWFHMNTLDRDLEFVKQMEANEPIKICTSYDDYMQASREGKVGVFFDVQDSKWLDNDFDRVKEYKEKGIHRMQLTYNSNNHLGGGCMDTMERSRDPGVTGYGRRFIDAMNEAKILVDVGHCSPNTAVDAATHSKSPIICSHAGIRDLAPSNPRTHWLADMKKVADKGGVFGIVGVPGALKDGLTVGNVGHFVDAIHFAVNYLGVDHVGFALDQVQAASFDEFMTSPDWPKEAVEAVNVDVWPWQQNFAGMENQSGYFNLVRGLVGKGYSEADIHKIMGGNMLRLIKEVC